MKSVLLDKFEKAQIAGKKLPDFQVGDTIRVHQRITEAVVEQKLSKTAKAVKKAREDEKGKGKAERIQVFEGVVLAKKHGTGLNGTFTVRKVIGPYGVEKTYPLHLPTIEKIEVVKRAKVRRAKLYYLRGLRGKKAKLKEKVFSELVVEEEKKEEIAPEVETQEGKVVEVQNDEKVKSQRIEEKTENQTAIDKTNEEKRGVFSKLSSKFKK
jgi:large subunit ribosomal protein L19